MGELDTKLGEVSLDDSTTYQATPFGKEMAKHFLFESGWRNLNHGISTYQHNTNTAAHDVQVPLALFLMLSVKSKESIRMIRKPGLMTLFDIHTLDY